MKRREFLAGAGQAAAAICTVGAACGSSPRPALALPPTDAPGWDVVRSQFALARDHLHFGAFLIASHPKPVRDAIEAHRRGFDENPVRYLEDNVDRCERRVRAAAAAHLGAGPDDIALTDSTTMGLGLVYGGLRLVAGQEIVTTEHDHYVAHESLRLKSVAAGAPLRRIALYQEPEQADEGAIVEAVLRSITPRVRVLALTWVHSGTGVKLPIRRIADALATVNRARDEPDRVLLCVDAVHGFAIEEARPAELGCDFFVAGCHKWLFGPRGTGVVWGSPAGWAAVRPTLASFDDVPRKRAWLNGTAPPSLTTGAGLTPGGMHSFDHRWALADAFELHKQIGPARIAARTHLLARQLKEGLAALPSVRLRTPRRDELSSGLVCCEVPGRETSTMVERLLQRRIVASGSPYASRYLRFSPSLLNTPAEVDQVLRELYLLLRS